MEDRFDLVESLIKQAFGKFRIPDLVIHSSLHGETSFSRSRSLIIDEGIPKFIKGDPSSYRSPQVVGIGFNPILAEFFLGVGSKKYEQIGKFNSIDGHELVIKPDFQPQAERYASLLKGITGKATKVEVKKNIFWYSPQIA